MIPYDIYVDKYDENYILVRCHRDYVFAVQTTMLEKEYYIIDIEYAGDFVFMYMMKLTPQEKGE